MSRLFYHVMQDNAGNLLFDVSGTMRLAGSGTLATIYGDEELTIILPNPMTNHPSYGSFKCFLGAGAYDFYMAKSGYTFETLTGVQGHGTMAQQDAASVAITGGAIAGVTLPLGSMAVQNAASVAITGGGGRFTTQVGIGTTGLASTLFSILYPAGTYGMVLEPSQAGSVIAVRLLNAAAADVGAIITNDTTTSYGTTSDVRLKHAIAPLTGALDVVRRLRPVSFLWNADGSPGRGFVADEVADVVDGVITGERDAVDDKGDIVPQMIDLSKLVPYLTAGLKDALALIDTLAARVASLETQLGV